MRVPEINPKIPMPSPSLYETDFYAWTTDLPKRTFPVECPYSLAEIVDYGFYPGEPSKLVDESE